MTYERIDISLLDRPEILKEFFYPRKSQLKPLPSNAKDYFIEVDEGINVGCRYYAVRKSYPS